MVSPPSRFLGQVPMQPALGSTVILKPHQTRCQKHTNPTGPLLPTKDALQPWRPGFLIRTVSRKAEDRKVMSSEDPKGFSCASRVWSKQMEPFDKMWLGGPR